MEAAKIALADQIPSLLRGETDLLAQWVDEARGQRTAFFISVIVVGTGAFGVAMGIWRSETQAVYTAVKLPLVILLTTLGNALLNGMLAPLLGLNLSWRQSWMAILMSFTIAAVILGAFSPLLLFLVWNLPPLVAGAGENQTTYAIIMVTQVAIIAFAGVTANLRLLELLRRLGGRAPAAYKVLFAWLAGNLLLGSQLSWILRPLVGSPGLEVQFLRPNAFQSNFFEALFSLVRHLLSG